jgi:predicted DNA-binding protein (MmcQ/YjbR family)
MFFTDPWPSSAPLLAAQIPTASEQGRPPPAKQQEIPAMKADSIYSTPTALPLLRKLRKIVAALPNTDETVTFGHPTFQVSGKTFAVFELYKGELGLALKVEKELQQVFLNDPRFYLTPYIGKHGWVTLRMESKLHWQEVRGMLKGSYGLVAAISKPTVTVYRHRSTG